MLKKGRKESDDVIKIKAIALAIVLALIATVALNVAVAHPKLVGDINGDGKVDVNDAIEAANAFGSVPDDPNWNEDADLNGDTVVDIMDLLLISMNFGQEE